MKSSIDLFKLYRIRVNNEAIENLFAYNKQLKEALLENNQYLVTSNQDTTKIDPQSLLQKKTLSFALLGDTKIEKLAKIDSELAEKTNFLLADVNDSIKRVEVDDDTAYYVFENNKEVEKLDNSDLSKPPSPATPLEKDDTEKSEKTYRQKIYESISDQISGTKQFKAHADKMFHKEVKEMIESTESFGLKTLQKTVSHLSTSPTSPEIKGMTPILPIADFKGEIPNLIKM